MKQVSGLILFTFLILFSSGSMHPVTLELKEQLESAPEDPALLYQNSYIPEMDSSDRAGMDSLRRMQKNGSVQKGSNLLGEQDKKQEEESQIKLPSVTQILLIAVVVIILIIYRLRVNKEGGL